MRRSSHWRIAATALMLLVAVAVARGGSATVALQDATPAATPASCDTAATPSAGMGMGMSTPTSGMAMGTPTMAVEFDQSYIDMMIPHHASIVALAQAALPRLTDDRLRTLAGEIISAQTAEVQELRDYREQFYGSPDPMMLSEQEMGRMMSGMTMPMGEMMAQMDATTQVATFCAAPDPDLAFIDLVIPHHQSAIVASEAALAEAVHPEIRDFAQRVIDAQVREIEELSVIRHERYGSATPEPVTG
ncbi:MAG: DUF305 domain-containing protein [Thermomicrobiales bacterium]